MNVLVTGAFQLNSGEREQLEAAGHKVFVHGDERAPVDSPELYEPATHPAHQRGA